MSTDLIFLAGPRAFEKIGDRGLSPDDVDVVVGASGAAKWLVLHGLESAIFGTWFTGRQKPLHLFGTSIGAWKSAAAARQDPVQAFDDLAHAYIHQYYEGKITPAQVSREGNRILNSFLQLEQIDEVLNHPYCRLHLSAVRCRGLMASDLKLPLLGGLMQAWAINQVSRRLYQTQCCPTLFFDPRTPPPFSRDDEFVGGKAALNRENLRQALLASGSIPFIMEGVRNIPGAPDGTYRDGGLYHYHPAFDFLGGQDGIALYPHFYPDVTLGWFDKNRKSRMADGRILADTLLIAPSPAFVETLPLGRIPDRRDFTRMAGRDKERVAFWEQTVAMSKQLGDQFLEAAASGKIRDQMQRIP
ncbi:MAG: hypothetical protein CSA22_08490 [Deltaproteobacteria bacterium]|nr:MAG: hypothetical protein CSA22_08490 [Deltaproteobacteria bacterium]